MFRVEWLRDLLAMPVPEAGKKGTKNPTRLPSIATLHSRTFVDGMLHYHHLAGKNAG